MAGGGVAIIAAALLTIGASAGSASLLGAETGLMLRGSAWVSPPALDRRDREHRLGGPLRHCRRVEQCARMVGATLGVAALGAVFALLQGGTEGLRAAMLLGGLCQIVAAGLCWRACSRMRLACRGFCCGSAMSAGCQGKCAVIRVPCPLTLSMLRVRPCDRSKIFTQRQAQAFFHILYQGGADLAVGAHRLCNFRRAHADSGVADDDIDAGIRGDELEIGPCRPSV